MTTTTDPITHPDGETPHGVTGDPFVVEVPFDVTTSHDNVQVPAGTYLAWRADDNDGSIVVWSPEHYACPVWVGLPEWDWTFPGEPARDYPEHDCLEHLRSGTVSGIYCGICGTDF